MVKGKSKYGFTYSNPTEYRRLYKKFVRKPTGKWCKHRGNRTAQTRRWSKKNPLKKRAHMIVYESIRNGKIIRPDVCSACHMKVKTQAHHKDYRYPLTIIWLCQSCHNHTTQREG